MASKAMNALLEALNVGPPALPEAAELTYEVLSFAGGLNTKASPLLLDRRDPWALQRNQVTRLENMIRTESGALQTRPGYSKLNSAALSPVAGDNTVRDIFENRRTGGAFDLLAHAGNTVYEYDGAGAFTALGTLITANTRIHWCQLGQRAIGFDGSNAPMYYDGSTFSTLSGSPPTAATVCASHRNRVFAGSGVTLYFCALSNPNDWTTANSAGSLPVPVTKGGSITGLFEFWDRLIIFTDYEIFQLTGAGPATYEIVPLSRKHGHQGSPYGVIAGANDVYFCNASGVHSLQGTMAHSETGDIAWDYDSAAIEPSWQGVEATNLSNIVAVNDSRRNQFMYLANTLGTTNAEAFVGDYYHVLNVGGQNHPSWGRYSNFAFSSACEAYSVTSGIPEVLLGGYNGYVYRHKDTDLTDDGTNIPIQFQYVTDMEEPAWEKTFRWMVLYARAQSGTLVSNATMDFGYRVLTQNTSLAQSVGDTIGSTFTIGTSALGTVTFLDHQIGIPGKGRTLTLTFNCSSAARVTIGGFLLYGGLCRTLRGRA